VEGAVEVALRGLVLPGHLSVPPQARGVVLFVHGTGSNHRSPRNRVVARRLSEVGVGALLLDLHGTDDDSDDGMDVELLAVRVLAATRWLRAQSAVRDLPVGYFGASTGAGVALLAAAEDPTIAAVVGRGGRPELAAACLQLVRAPTLLIVGGADPAVLARNQEASRQLRSEHELVVVPGATHLFAEPGALEAVSDHSARWFVRHLVADPSASRGVDPR
jgi:putative phosphoribosyl transferase